MVSHVEELPTSNGNHAVKAEDSSPKRIKQDALPRLVEAWKSSGLTQKDFCKINNLSYSSFKNWRQKLHFVNPPLKKGKAGFSQISLTPVSAVPQEAKHNVKQATLKIVYPSGIQVFLDAQNQERLVKSLIVGLR